MPDRQSLLGLHQQSWWFNAINYLKSITKVGNRVGKFIYQKKMG